MSDLPKIAIRGLHQKNAAAGVHPDPNLISAFVENSLPRDSRAHVVQHLAQCTDCREVAFLSSPDQAATMPAATFAPANWLTWPVLRWGAAVAAVVVVAAAVSLHRQSGGSSMQSGAIRMTDAPSAKEAAVSAPQQEETRGPVATAKPAPVASAIKNDLLSDSGGSRTNQLKKQGSREKAASDSSDELGNQTVEVTAAQVQVHAEDAQAEAGQVVPGRAKDSAAEQASGSGIGGGVLRGDAAAAQRPSPIFPPVIAPRWTLTSEGTLQRSLDFGRTWQTIAVANQASFRALAASGRDIWVGGSKGALYHSIDAGLNWSQVQPVASGQALADDVIGVEFPDSLHGKLTTSTKETWTTEDGGQSWRKQ